MKKNEYLQKRYNRIKFFLRIRLGIQQLKIKPYLSIFIIAIIIAFALFWKNKAQLYVHVPELIMPICRSIVHVLGISLFIFSIIFILYMIGALTARHDEGDLIIAFDEKDLQNGCPILMKKIYDKETKVTIREFYSNISLRKWLACREDIEDSMDIHFVKPDIEYGGKNKNSGKRIVLYTAKGRKAIERAVLYDDE